MRDGSLHKVRYLVENQKSFLIFNRRSWMNLYDGTIFLCINHSMINIRNTEVIVLVCVIDKPTFCWQCVELLLWKRLDHWLTVATDTASECTASGTIVSDPDFIVEFVKNFASYVVSYGRFGLSVGCSYKATVVKLVTSTLSRFEAGTDTQAALAKFLRRVRSIVVLVIQGLITVV